MANKEKFKETEEMSENAMLRLRRMLGLLKLAGVFTLSMAMSVPASAFDAFEHLKAVGVLWGLERNPGGQAATGRGSHLGLIEQPGNPPPKYAVMVTPRDSDPCVIDQVSSLHQEESSGYLMHTVIDLKKVAAIKISGGSSLSQVTMTGVELICRRTLGLPNSTAPSRADIECLGMKLWDMNTETDKQAVMAALAIIDKTCPLAGFEP